jgi:hypothetical protein
VEIPFCWLVPGDVYNGKKAKFTVRPFLDASGEQQSKFEKALASRIVRYIVHIPTKKGSVR